jgi:hypothetical protein
LRSCLPGWREAKPDDQRAGFEAAQRGIGVRRDERDRLEAIAFERPPARHPHALPAVEPGEREAVVRAGRAERLERLLFGNRAVVRPFRPAVGAVGPVANDLLDRPCVGAHLVVSELRVKGREEASQGRIAGQERRQRDFDYH